MARVGTASKNAWGFVPTTIPSCSLWLDAADPSTLFTDDGVTQATVGNSVQYWKDKSINASFARQATLANKPVLQTELPGATSPPDLRSLYFSGGSQLLALPNGSNLPLGTSDGTYFIVCRIATSVTNASLYVPFSHGGGVNGATVAPARSFFAAPIQYGGFICTQTGAFSNNNAYMPSLITGGVKDYIIYGFFNGSAFLSNNLQNLQGGQFVSSGGTLSTNAYVGAPAATGIGTSFIGNVCEILVYNRALDNYERQQVEGYLAWKWGVPGFPEMTHPYYTPLAQGFHPSSILGTTSCRLWLDASKLTGANGSQVTSWLDYTGIGNSAINAGNTAPTLSTNSQNGLNTVAFNGSQFLDLLSPGSLVGTQSNFSLMFVAQSTNASPSGRQTLFTQGGVAYPNALNAANPSNTIAEAYFNSTNKLSLDTLGVPTGSIPTTTSTYTNNYVLVSAIFQSNQTNTIQGWETGTVFPTQSGQYIYNLGRATARIGASRPLSTMTIIATTIPNTVTVTTTGGPPCVNQIFNSMAAVGGVTPDINYFIGSVSGTSNPYTIILGTGFGNTNVSITSTTTGQSVAAQAYTTINATTITGNKVTITSSTLPTVGQTIIFPTSIAGIVARTLYYILSVDATAAPSYVVTLSLTSGGTAITITSNLTSQGVPQQLVANYLTGNIAEMIYYNSLSVSTTQRQRLEGYLAWKWGLQASLPTTHPFYLANYFYNSTRPTSRLFLPTDIEGCQLWIDPTDLKTAGYAVSAWNDKSGNSNNATQTTASLRPYYVPSQKAIYTGSTEYLNLLTSTSLALFQNIGYASMYIVLRIPSGTVPASQNSLFTATTGTGGSRFTPAIIPSGSPNTVYGGLFTRLDAEGSSTVSSAGISYPYDGITILNFELNYSTNTYTLSRNGSQDVNNAAAGLTTSGLTSNTASTSVTISSLNTASRQNNFYIHEILLYTSSGTALTSTQRNDNHGYLAWKWGIQNSLPSTNTWSPLASTPATSGPSTPVTGSKLWLDGSDASTITYGTTVAMLTDKSGSDNAAVNNASTLTMTTYAKPEGNTQPILLGPNPGTSNFLTTRTIASRDTSNHTYAFVAKYPGFNPEQIAGCALWLDASDGNTVTVTGSNVTAWKDKAVGYTGTASNNTAIQYVSNALNGLPVIRVGATAAYFTFGNVNDITTEEFNIFAVARATGSIGKIGAIIGKGSGTNGWWFGYNPPSYLQTQSGTGSTLLNNTIVVVSGLTNYNVLSSMNPRTSATTQYLNGTSVGTGGSTTVSLSTTSDLRVGSTGNNYTVTNTDFAEIIMYIGSISTTQRQQIEGYLAWKWGLQANLPAGHPYLSVSPIITTSPTNVLSYYAPPTTTSFLPTQISGCSLWLDGSDPLNTGIQPTPGATISTWTDKSGNGRNATVASGRVAGTFNAAFNCVYFQASTVGYVTSYPANPTNETMFIVANIDSPANVNNNTIIGGQLGARSFGFGYSATGGSSYLNNEVAWQSNSITGPSAGITALITGTVSGTTNVTVSLNGATSGATYRAGTITAWTAGTTTYLGVDTTTTAYYYKGYVMEILFYNSVLTTAQRQQIEGYLASKWGIQSSLPTTHPYYYGLPYTVTLGGTETFGHSGTTSPILQNNNAIVGGANTYAAYGTYASADAFYGGNTFVCICVRQNGVWTFTTNGVSYTTVAPYALRKLASGQYTIQVNNNGGIQLGDVIVYNNAISPGEQQQLEGYLAWKWGLQRSGNAIAPFPTTHPFYKNPPATTLPIVSATQYFKKTFDVSDFSPALWLDANDPNTYVLDANNRVQWMSNKGLGIIKQSFNLTSVLNSANFTVNTAASLSPGQAFEISNAGATITGIPTIISTPAAPIFFFVLSVSGTTITISSTFGGTALTGAGAGTSACYVSQRFTKPVGTSSGVGLNGPLLTQSAVGTGNGLNYLDFSSGGSFRITGGITDSAGTSVVLTLNATHNIPATRQVRVVVSGGTYSTDASSATGITGTYIVSAQTGTTITIPYTSSKVSATINSIVGYVEYGSIIISNITMSSVSSTAVFTTSFAHGLTTSDSVFLSLAGSTIANFPVALNIANGVYTPSAVTGKSFTITSLVNLGSATVIESTGAINTSLSSTTSPSYAYFPYNGYALESLSATGIFTGGSIFVVTHTNPGAGSLAASSIARCGRNVETQPPIFAVAQTVNAASGTDIAGVTGGNVVAGLGRDFNVRLANYNAVGSQLATSTVPSIRLGVKRNTLSNTSVALTDTSRSITNTTNGFRVMNTLLTYTSSGTATEPGSYSTTVTSCGWKPTNYSPNTSTFSQSAILGNTTYANNTQFAGLPVYQVSSTGTIVTLTFIPYGLEPNYIPFYPGQNIYIDKLTGSAAGYVGAGVVLDTPAPTSTTVSYSKTITAGTITGQTGIVQIISGLSIVSPHIRIGADTNATTGYSSLAGYLTDRFFDGGIAEILAFNTIHTPEQRMLVEGYLAQKYNFQEYLGAETNLITNGMAFSVGNSISNVTCSGTTATITFTNPYSTNPFVPGAQIIVGGTIAPTGYTGTFIIVSVTGTNQVSYSVASALANSTSVSGVTVTASRTQNNLFIHPYRAGPANISSNLGSTQSNNLALWYDAANYSSLTLSGTSVLTWTSRLGTVGYATNVLLPSIAGYNFKYVANSQNGLPGLDIMSTVALTGVTLTSVTTSTNILTVTSSTPIVANQLITFATATSGIAINAYYIVRSGVTGTNPYSFTVATSIGGAVVSIPATTTGLSIACQLFTVGLMNTSGITAGTLSTANTNTEFTYFYVLKRNVAGYNAQLTQQIVSLGPTTGTRFLLVDDLFTMADATTAAGVSAQTTSMNYATRGGLLKDTAMILAVYKRGRNLYSRMIGGGKTSQFTQTFSRDTQMPTASGLQLYVGTYGSSTNVGFNGTLYEMMFFRDALTDQAIQQTEGYLAQKWGLRSSLPPTHSYYSTTA